MPARWRLRGRKGPEDIAQPGFSHFRGGPFGREPFALALQPFRKAVAKVRDPKRIDCDNAGNGLPRTHGLVIGEHADGTFGDLALNPRLLPGFARRRCLGCQIGDQVAFGNDPAPGIPAGNQKNLQIAALPPPAQRPGLDADRARASDRPRRIFAF